MSNEVAIQPGPGAMAQAETREDRDIIYKAFGTDDTIKLNMAIIRNYVAVPYVTMQGNQQVTMLPDNRECLRFAMLCRGQRADPFQGDAYMVPFWDKKLNKPVWSLVTGINCFRKRAEANADFDGMESGVIVLTEEDEMKELEGDFLPPGVRLLGGWAVVHRKNIKIPTRRKVNLAVYKKPFGVWLNDEAGMIVKVAEASALRDSFPTLLGGFQLREEVIDLDPARVEVAAPVGKRPDFARGLPAPNVEAMGNPSPRAQNAHKTAAAAPPVNTALRVTEAPPAQARAQAAPVQPKPEPQPTQPPPVQDIEATTAPVPEALRETAPPQATPDEPAAEPAPDAEAGGELPAAEAEAEAQAEAPVDRRLQPDSYDDAHILACKRYCLQYGVTYDQLWAWLKEKKVVDKQDNLMALNETKRASLGNDLWWKKNGPALAAYQPK